MSKEESPDKDKISELFKDPKFITFVRKVLPELFNQLQIDFMDGNKVNPAVGIPRQKLLTAMFEVNEEGSIKEDSEMDGQKDVHLYDKPVSIKAVTCHGKGNTRSIEAKSIKLSWGGNAESETKKKQRESFNPQYSMIIASFAMDFDGTNHSGNWTVGLIYVPQQVVEAVFGAAEHVGAHRLAIPLGEPARHARGVRGAVADDALALVHAEGVVRRLA